VSTQLTYRASVILKGYDGVTPATIDAAVQEARRRVFMARRWSWLEATNATLATVANVTTVSLATITDLAHIDAVRLSDASGKIPLDWCSRTIMRDLQDRYGTTSTGTPEVWTRVEGSLVFWPTPSRVLTVTVEYAKAAADLAASPAVDIIPDKNQDLVVWAAVVPLAFRQRELSASSAADQFFTKVLLPQHAGQDGVEQRQTSEQIRSGYWGS
jgi:hypothetical protein